MTDEREALRRLKADRTSLHNADTGWTLTIGRSDIFKLAKDRAQRYQNTADLAVTSVRPERANQ